MHGHHESGQRQREQRVVDRARKPRRDGVVERKRTTDESIHGCEENRIEKAEEEDSGNRTCVTTADDEAGE